jgi:general secretion pathway protein M
MKNYLDTLNEREKGLFWLGLCVVFFYIYYYVIYAPLEQAIMKQKAQLTEKIATKQWMNQVKPQNLDQKSLNKQELLTVLAGHLKEGVLQEYPYQLEQTGAGEIELRFKAVPFNLFLQWLIPFSQKYPFLIREWQVTRSKTPGVTQITFRIQSS